MSILLSRRELEARPFARAQLDTLFGLVLIDDEVDPAAALPARITLDHDPALLADAFRICRQLWIEGVDPAGLAAMVAQVGRDGDLDPADRIRFKHMRAKLKLFRFACALFGRSHTYPMVTDHLTTALGHLQDGFRNGQRQRVMRKARVIRFLLSPLPAAILRRERDRIWLVDPADFRAFTLREVARLPIMLARPGVTGAEFHAARKVLSRQVAFYTAAHTLRPSEQHASMFFSLAAINGLMGDMHDRLVERRVAGLQDYHRERFPLPTEIHERIAALVECYRASRIGRAL